jgi:hypothetical protein
MSTIVVFVSLDSFRFISLRLAARVPDGCAFFPPGAAGAASGSPNHHLGEMASDASNSFASGGIGRESCTARMHHDAA